MTETTTAVGFPKSVGELVKRDDVLATLQQTASNALSAPRLMGIILGEIRTTPKLLRCTPESFYAAIIKVATWGLVPGLTCHLIPYGSECQVQQNYKGMLDLARRSGEILYVAAHAVHEHDEFSYAQGLHPDMRHTPKLGDRGVVIAFYAAVKLRGGAEDFEVMTKAEVDAVRKNNNSPAWREYYGEMGRKTVLKRLLKRLPFSLDVSMAIREDDEPVPTRYGLGTTVIDVDATIAEAEEELAEEERKITEAPAAAAAAVTEKVQQRRSRANGRPVPESAPNTRAIIAAAGEHGLKERDLLAYARDLSGLELQSFGEAHSSLLEQIADEVRTEDGCAAIAERIGRSK